MDVFIKELWFCWGVISMLIGTIYWVMQTWLTKKAKQKQPQSPELIRQSQTDLQQQPSIHARELNTLLDRL